MGGLTNRNIQLLFLTVLEAGPSKFMVSSLVSSGEALFLACRCLSHVRESNLSMSLPIKALTPLDKGLAFMTSSHSNYLPKVPTPNTTIELRIRDQHVRLRGM